MKDEAEPDLGRRGWDALAAADWDLARSCFEQAREAGESAEVLDGLSRALHFKGEYAAAIELAERAFVAYREQKMPVEAADCARGIAFLHGTVKGNMAAAGGWMARAEGLLDGVDECAGHGWLTLDLGVFTSDATERAQLATAALAIARRYGDVDLEYDALALLGDSYVASGRVAEGMKLLDEAMTAVSAGEVSGVVSIGDIYCRLLGACEAALDITRAEQWMEAAGGFDAWSDFVSPVCRDHYGGILIAVGRWTEAEEQLLAAISTFERSYRAMRQSSLRKLADLRLRQGRLDEARRLLEGDESHPVSRRILAAIAMSQGELALAEDLVQLCLDAEDSSDPACGPALELLVQIRMTRDDLGGASEALQRLTALASESDDERTAGLAELSAGRVLAREQDERASSHLQAAMREFAELGLRVEAAQAQLELARAIAATAPDAAIAEARLAMQAFERIGAVGDADAAGGLLRELGASGRAWPKHHGTLTKRETEVLSLLAEGCSNAQIAERLYISRRTAEHHVASILSKLDLRGRAEAAAYAVRELGKDS